MDKFELHYEVGRALRWLAHLSLVRIDEVYQDKDLANRGNKAIPRSIAIVNAEDGLTCIELDIMKEMLREFNVEYRVEGNNSIDAVNNRVCLCGECWPVD